MTITIDADANNDIYIGKNGSLVVSSGLTAVMQACQQAAQAQLGEMVFAVDSGIPTMDSVFSAKPNIPRFEAYLRSAINAVADVIEVKSLTSQSANGVLSYTATILTIYGEISING